jgi:hypothetical protein
MDQGLCVLFLPRTGRVTLVNIVPGLDNYRLAVLSGEAIGTGMVFPGNPLKVHFAADYRAVIEWIGMEGLGHHWMVTYGDLQRPLEDLAGMVGCDLVIGP